MKCNKCKKQIFSNGLSFCPYCGAYLINSSYNSSYSNKKSSKNNNDYNILSKLIYLFLIIIWIAIVVVFYNITKEFYYFDDDEDLSSSTSYSTVINSDSNAISATVSGPGETSIKHENKYVKSYVNSVNDVYSLIIEDSNKQKDSCPSEIIKIENEIVSNYKIKAVNLCEMTQSLAYELKEVVAYIYNNYPNQRGYLTNLTLANVTNEKYIAAFMPIFVFVTSETNNTYPIGVKTQIILNSAYFLDEAKFDSSIKHGTNIGYYPPNATRGSTVAHEFGHYLSFRAMLKYYNTNSVTYVKNDNANTIFKIYDDFLAGNFSYRIVNTAYMNYLNAYSGTMSLTDFKKSISSYAVAKNKDGSYINDETIAEAFHDCYLNGDNAKLASKLIIEELSKYL